MRLNSWSRCGRRRSAISMAVGNWPWVRLQRERPDPVDRIIILFPGALCARSGQPGAQLFFRRWLCFYAHVHRPNSRVEGATYGWILFRVLKWAVSMDPYPRGHM